MNKNKPMKLMDEIWDVYKFLYKLDGKKELHWQFTYMLAAKLEKYMTHGNDLCCIYEDPSNSVFKDLTINQRIPAVIDLISIAIESSIEFWQLPRWDYYESELIQPFLRLVHQTFLKWEDIKFLNMQNEIKFKSSCWDPEDWKYYKINWEEREISHITIENVDQWLITIINCVYRTEFWFVSEGLAPLMKQLKHLKSEYEDKYGFEFRKNGTLHIIGSRDLLEILWNIQKFQNVSKGNKSQDSFDCI